MARKKKDKPKWLCVNGWEVDYTEVKKNADGEDEYYIPEYEEWMTWNQLEKEFFLILESESHSALR